LDGAHSGRERGSDPHAAIFDYNAPTWRDSHRVRSVKEKTGVGLPRTHIVGTEDVLAEKSRETDEIEGMPNFAHRTARSDAHGLVNRAERFDCAGHCLKLAFKNFRDPGTIRFLESDRQTASDPRLDICANVSESFPAIPADQNGKIVIQVGQKV